MTGLDTLTQPNRAQPTRRGIDPIASRSRQEPDSSSSGASFDDVLAKTSRDTEAPPTSAAPTGSASPPLSDHAAKQGTDVAATTDTGESAETGDGTEVIDIVDSLDVGETTDVLIGTESDDRQALAESIEAVDGSESSTGRIAAEPFRHLAQQAAAAEATSSGGAPVPPEAVATIDNAGSAVPSVASDAAPRVDAPAPAASLTGAQPGTAPAATAERPAPGIGVGAEADVVAGAEADVAVEAEIEASSGVSTTLAATSTATTAEAAAGDVGTQPDAEPALAQAATRAVAEDAAAARTTGTPASRAAPVVAADAGATSDLAGLDASSGDPVAPEAVPTLTAAQRGAEASTRLTEHVAMREMFDRIERHRSSIDGSIELEILTERFGAIRIEAAESRDGVHLSLRGGNGDERALADLADELRQEFERNGVDLAGLDVGDRKGGQPAAEAIEGSREGLAGVGQSDLDDSPLRRLGGDGGRLDLRL